MDIPEPDSDIMELNMQTAEHSTEAIATPAPSSASVGNVTASTAGNPASSSGSQTEETSFITSVPLEIFTAVAQGAKVVSSVAPVPWLGPAMELVASIARLCQNVPKNRCSAVELSSHCEKMLETVKQTRFDMNKVDVSSMLEELGILLNKIKEQLEKWNKLGAVKAFLKQEIISDGIKSYHVEIDQFCKRYTIVTQGMIINWLEVHEQQSKVDVDGVKEFFLNIANQQELKIMCQRELIEGVRENVRELLGLMQRLLLQSEEEPKRKALEANMSSICRTTTIMPPDIELTEGFLKWEGYPRHGNSGFFDIYKGTCFGDVPCAIKQLRHRNATLQTKKRFERQHKHWKSINQKDQGRYILQLIGAVYRIHPTNSLMCFVSPWMENGNARDYVKLGKCMDRIDLIRGIAKGLEVLHTHDPPLVHGYVKGTNVLIDHLGNPLLADFGLMRIVEEERISISSYPSVNESFRWLPPEMIPGLGHSGENSSVLSIESDIFMFAMTALELMTDKKPYAHIKNDPQVLLYRKDGGKPRKLEAAEEQEMLERGLDSRLWELLERCWLDDQERRPTIREVLDMLETLPTPSI